MLTLGRLAALAASVERATRQDERARQLNERIELTREIHERVMQRLFGLVLALGSGQPLTAEERQTCHDQLQAVLGDLRSALGRPISIARAPAARRRSPSSSAAAPSARPSCGSTGAEAVEVPAHLEELAQSVFLEALRNCEKHARRDADRGPRGARPATRSSSRSPTTASSSGAGAGAGLGLRLLTIEALQQDALVEFGAPARAGAGTCAWSAAARR